MLLLGFLFSPICALLFLFMYLRTSKIKLVHVGLVVFLISFIGIYWFPWGDNQSHFAIYYSDTVNRYYNFVLSSSYWLYDYVISLIANITGQYIWGYFFWLFVPFLIFSLLIWHKVDTPKIPNNNKWLLLILLILFLGIREFLDLNRNTNAGIFLSITAIIWNKNKYLSIICILISLLLHDSVRYFVLFLPLGYLLYKQSQKRIDIILIVAVVISGVIIKIIAPMIISERNMDLYFGTGAGLGVNSGYMKLQGYTNILICLIQYLLISKYKNIIDKYMYVFYLTSILLTATLSSMWVGRERYLLISNIIAISIIIINWNTIYFYEGIQLIKKIKWLYSTYALKIILNLMLVYSSHYVFNSATTNNEVEFSVVTRSIYMPTFLLFDIEEYGFSNQKFLQLYNRVNYEIEY